MWWRGSQAISDQMPWYRQPGYDGDLSETQKRLLDQVRARSRHPAARAEDLPAEALSYIKALEFNLYQAKQQQLIGRTLLVSLFGAAVLYLTYYGYRPGTSNWDYVVGFAVLILPWFLYLRENRKQDRRILCRRAARRCRPTSKSSANGSFPISARSSSSATSRAESRESGRVFLAVQPRPEAQQLEDAAVAPR